jgi:sensor domain CHASE-containing protein
MSLRSKIVIILFAVVLVYALSDHLILRTTVSRRFEHLERAEAREDVDRVLEAIQQEVLNLDKLCFDWSVRDQTYEFVQGRDQRFVEANLGLNTFRSNRIELFYICDNEGRVVWGDIRDPDSGAQIRVDEFPSEVLSKSHPLLLRSPEAEKKLELDFKRGLYTTSSGPMLVSSRPILPSRGGGKSRGRVIVGKFCDPELLRNLHDQTLVPFALWSMDGTKLPPKVEAVLDEATSSRDPVLREEDENLHAYATIADINDFPALILRASMQRDIARAGTTAVSYSLLSTTASGLILLMVLLYLLQRTVIAPLSRLTQHAVAIGRNEHLTAKIDLQRDDELGILSRELDNMVEKLAQSRAALAQTARAAGMSEISSGILHNVGNVLNSVNVAATLVGEKTQDLCVADLEAVAGMLAQNADDLAAFVTRDPRGKQLQHYLQTLAQHLRNEQRAIAEEVAGLSNGIAHIRELIRAQQGLAKCSSLTQPVRVPDEVEEALTISNRALSIDPDLEVVREYDDVTAELDKHKLLEIVVNLIQNARQAMLEAQIPKRRLTLRTLAQPDGRFRIEVTDNGVGIPEASVVKVFQLGFTTKVNGHGFGLHTSANAAHQMGGSLNVHSAGPGQGATFVLDLPLRPPQAVQAA